MVKAHLLCALLPLCACTIYTLPELDTAGSSTDASTGPSATTGDDPTTSAGVEAIEIDEAGPVKVPVGEIVTIGATVLDADGLPVPAARARPAPRSTPSKRLKPTPRRAICMCSR